jgi:hypothetical protein
MATTSAWSWTIGQIVAVRLALVLLSILGVAALVLVLIVIVVGIIFFRRPVYYATAHIEIISKKGPLGAHPVESLALLDQMRGPRPGGPRARQVKTAVVRPR